MGEIHLKDLSPKSQRSRFGQSIVGEATALRNKYKKMGIQAPLKILEGSARANIAHKVYENRLRSEMDTDPLTGALSRRAILRGTREALAEVDRKGGSLHIIFMDLKGLKRFNDDFGHEAGDAALKFLVKGVKQNIRPYDEIGRYGGDEFILLIKNGESQPADRIMENLDKTLSKLDEPYNSIRSTMGVANYHQGMETSADQLIRQADQAFYFAKREHIDTPVAWNSSMNSIVIPK